MRYNYRLLVCSHRYCSLKIEDKDNFKQTQTKGGIENDTINCFNHGSNWF